MRIIFLGTSKFAVPALTAVLEAGYKIQAVVTQPDRPKGRGLKISASPVKQAALKQGLPIYQPEDVNSRDFAEELMRIGPELILSAAYGQKIPPRVLATSSQGVWNIHPSLLPQYRGASPVVWAILNGEKKTGVTLFLMEEEMDAGDIIAQEETDIGDEETAGELELRLAEIGAQLVVRALRQLEKGEIFYTPQDATAATFARRLKKEDGLIDWRKSAEDVVNQVRAMNPWPGAFTYLKPSAVRLGIWRAALGGQLEGHKHDEPGTVLAVEEYGIIVRCGSGAVLLKEVQPAGGRRMTARDYIHGHKIASGDRMGQR